MSKQEEKEGEKALKESSSAPKQRMSGTADADLGFHAANGFHFKRLKDGSVTLSLVKKVVDQDDVKVQVTVSPSEWASVVASMSSMGETSKTHRIFEAFQIP